MVLRFLTIGADHFKGGGSILNLIPTSIVGFLLAGSLGPVTIILLTVLTAFLSTFTYGLIGMAVALVYARLREIKEGVSVDNLAAVFE